MDKKRILSAIFIAGILAFISTSIGAMWDFQDVKRKVGYHDTQLRVIGMVVCEYAIRDELPDSSEKCIKMLRGN